MKTLATVAAVFALTSAYPAFASDTTADRMGAAKVPETAEEHTAMAAEYQKKATEWRKEAEFHRQMAAAYKASHPDSKGGVRNAPAVKMEKHCMTIVEDSERLAADAEWAAKYHHARAKELQAR